MTQISTLTDKEVIELYESGKSRRYQLLFSVNGGAYVIFSLLLEKHYVNHQTMVIGFLALLMVGFSFTMGYDIYKFGSHMRDDFTNNVGLFGPPGQRVLQYLVGLLVVAWIGVIAASRLLT
jgi:hypothetical protein